MKTLIVAAALLLANSAIGQSDSTTAASKQKPDTLRIGGMVIIKDQNNRSTTIMNDSTNNQNGKNGKSFNWNLNKNKKSKTRSGSTSYFVVDLGLSNFVNKTNFATADAKSYARTIRPNETAFSKNDFKLNNIKSTNINLWLFLHERNPVNRVLCLKYGFGLEMNNYSWEQPLTFVKANPTYLFRDSAAFSKNYLRLSYLTVPIWLKINTNSKVKNPITISAGASFGYRTNSFIKQKSTERGKQEVNSSFDTKDWKVSYIGELGLGKIKLYGSYSPNNIFSRGLDLRPYTIGIRLN
jgi:hypothetical protein